MGTGATLQTPEGLGVDLLRGALYVTSFTGTTLRRIDLATRAVTTVAGTAAATTTSLDGIGTAATIYSCRGAAFDTAANLLYFTAWSACSIRAYNASSGAVRTLSSTSCASVDGVGTSIRFYSPSGLRMAGGALWVAESNSGNFRRVGIAAPGVLGYVR